MQQKNQPKSNQSRTEATRAALIRAARRLFAEKGYAETSTPEIVKAAGVTRGALYHHFDDKTALFHAVVTAEYEAVAKAINKTVQETPANAVAALTQGSRAYMDAMQAPGRVRIMLRDGPAVLGQTELARIDRESSADTLRIGLKAAMEAGEIRDLPLDALTLQLVALFDRAALAVAEGEDPEAHLSVLTAIIATLKPEE